MCFVQVHVHAIDARNKGKGYTAHVISIWTFLWTFSLRGRGLRKRVFSRRYFRVDISGWGCGRLTVSIVAITTRVVTAHLVTRYTLLAGTLVIVSC